MLFAHNIGRGESANFVTVLFDIFDIYIFIFPLMHPVILLNKLDSSIHHQHFAVNIFNQFLAYLSRCVCQPRGWVINVEEKQEDGAERSEVGVGGWGEWTHVVHRLISMGVRYM